jgi:hypothetical protein
VNLKEMRERIANKTDFDPTETRYRDQMTDLLNEAYRHVWNETVWPFSQKLVYMDLYPDLTSTRLDGQTVTTNDGQRVVTFSAPVSQLLSQRDVLVGNIIELHGRDYEILQINTDTQLITTEPIRHPVAGSPPVSPPTITGFAGWKIKHRYYELPSDCLEILNLGQRDTPIPDAPGALTLGQKMWSCANRPEEMASLREDRTDSYAQMYFPIPPRVVPPAEKLSIQWAQVETTADGTFAQAQYYEFCWCLESPAGTFGPLSEPQITQVPTDAQQPAATYAATVTFSTFDGVAFAARPASYTTRGQPEPLEGLKKRLWFNANFNHSTGERLGQPRWLAVTTGATLNTDTTATMNLPLSALDVESTLLVKYVLGLYPGNERYVEFDGSIRRIRPWPRVDGSDQEYSQADAATNANWRDRPARLFRRAELRYLVKPAPLVYDTDSPSMPWPFHQVIVDRALCDVFLKSNNTALAQLYEGRYNRAVEQFKRRMFKTDTQWQMGQFQIHGDRQYWSSEFTLTYEG